MIIENKKTLKEIVLGILFVAGEGIEKSFIQEKLNITEKELDKALQELQETYAGDNGIHIITFKNKVQLCSNPKYADLVNINSNGEIGMLNRTTYLTDNYIKFAGSIDVALSNYNSEFFGVGYIKIIDNGTEYYIFGSNELLQNTRTIYFLLYFTTILVELFLG